MDFDSPSPAQQRRRNASPAPPARRETASNAAIMLTQADCETAQLTDLSSAEKVGAIMGRRYLGIDFGERYVGLAISDAAGRLAVPREVLTRQDDDSLCAAIQRIAREESIDGLAIGDPINLDGAPGAASERVHRFGEKLAAMLQLPVEYVAETLTSDEARRRRRAAGGRSANRLDAIAAQILLQEFLETLREGR